MFWLYIACISGSVVWYNYLYILHTAETLVVVWSCVKVGEEPDDDDDDDVFRGPAVNESMLLLCLMRRSAHIKQSRVSGALRFN